MKEAFKIIVVLTVICLICAFFLSFVFSVAKEKIEMNAKRAIEEGISKLAPCAKRVEEIKLKDEVVYKLFDEQDNSVGYAFLAQGQGYQGKIKILAVVDSSLEKLEGIEVVESVETPGLGARITEALFREQFKKLTVIPKIEYVKEEVEKDNQIMAITGATVTSGAVINILNKRIEELREELKG